MLEGVVVRYFGIIGLIGEQLNCEDIIMVNLEFINGLLFVLFLLNQDSCLCLMFFVYFLQDGVVVSSSDYVFICDFGVL